MGSGCVAGPGLCATPRLPDEPRAVRDAPSHGSALLVGPPPGQLLARAGPGAWAPGFGDHLKDLLAERLDDARPDLRQPEAQLALTADELSKATLT